MEGLRFKNMLKRFALPDWFVITAFIASISIVMFLFYLDEGFYNFNWMKEPGAWIVFFLYWNIFFWPAIGIGFLSKLINKK